MPVRVGAHKRLVSGKIFCGIFQTELLCAFPGKPAVCRILWIITDDVVVGFDFIIILVFAVTGIQFHAFCIESKSVTVYAVQKIMVTELHFPVFIQNGLPSLFIVFENKIAMRPAVIGIFNCYVFQYCHSGSFRDCLSAVRR